MFFTLENTTSIPLVQRPWFLSPDWDRAPGTQPKPATATATVPTSLSTPATQSDPAAEWRAAIDVTKRKHPDWPMARISSEANRNYPTLRQRFVEAANARKV